MTLKIGDTVWVFDHHRRVYPPDKKGGPIFREHFYPVTIKSATTRSWVLSNGRKVNRKTLAGIFVSEADVEKRCWVQENRYRISRQLERCDDYEVFKSVEKLLSEVSG